MIFNTQQRREMVDTKLKRISLRKQCNLLSVARSSLSYQAVGESEENLLLMRMMDIHHLEHPCKGVLQMQDFLRDKGFYVNHKRIRRLMRLMNIQAIYPKKNLSKLGLAQYIKPYLLRDLTIDRPNQVWCTDITYIAMKQGFMYLSAFIDVHSRYIVDWHLTNSLTVGEQLILFQKSLVKSQPEIINTDQGSQYTCNAWVEALNKENIQISMDGKGRATDNAYIERFWRTIKQEYIYLYPSNDGLTLYKGIEKFVHYYNNERSHQGINRTKPVVLYQRA